jgi:hypothetical protein
LDFRHDNVGIYTPAPRREGRGGALFAAPGAFVLRESKSAGGCEELDLMFSCVFKLSIQTVSRPCLLHVSWWCVRCQQMSIRLATIPRDIQKEKVREVFGSAAQRRWVKTLIRPICVSMRYSLKVVVSYTTIIAATVAAAPFESGVPNHMGTGHPCQASHRVPCLHERCVCHVSPPFRMGSPAFACSSAQKRAKSLWSSCW